MTASSNVTTTVENIGDGNPAGSNVFQSGEKGAFFGATPIVKPVVTSIATATATTTLLETRILRLETALVNLGLIAKS